MVEQSKGLPAHAIPSVRSSYVMAYRAERAMYNQTQPLIGQILDWEGAYKSCQHFHPLAARMASVSFQARHMADPFAWGWTARYSPGDIQRARSRVRRLPASRLPGLNPEYAARLSRLGIGIDAWMNVGL